MVNPIKHFYRACLARSGANSFIQEVKLRKSHELAVRTFLELIADLTDSEDGLRPLTRFDMRSLPNADLCRLSEASRQHDQSSARLAAFLAERRGIQIGQTVTCTVISGEKPKDREVYSLGLDDSAKLVVNVIEPHLDILIPASAIYGSKPDRA